MGDEHTDDRARLIEWASVESRAWTGWAADEERAGQIAGRDYARRKAKWYGDIADLLTRDAARTAEMDALVDHYAKMEAKTYQRELQEKARADRAEAALESLRAVAANYLDAHTPPLDHTHMVGSTDALRDELAPPQAPIDLPPLGTFNREVQPQLTCGVIDDLIERWPAAAQHAEWLRRVISEVREWGREGWRRALTARELLAKARALTRDEIAVDDGTAEDWLREIDAALHAPPQPKGATT